MTEVRSLSTEEEKSLESQSRRLMPRVEAEKLAAQSRRHWDLFYKRNGGRFFKRRHWTEREFAELTTPLETLNANSSKPVLLELGCGAGDLVMPLVEAGCPYFIMACDLSPRAVELVKTDPLYDENKVIAFQADVTGDDLLQTVSVGSVHLATMVFLLSAVPPAKFHLCLANAFEALKPGGSLLFRDYARYDMAQFRFKPGRMIADNFYARQDGTLTYFFELNELSDLFSKAGFTISTIEYVERRTVNKKENLDVPRLFVQAKLVKPAG